MKQGFYTLSRRKELAQGVWELRLAGDTAPITAPGQFVDIQVDGCFLRRPISVCDWDKEGLTIVFKVVGQGTAALAGTPEGRTLDLLCGLGNGFDLSQCGRRPLLVGGGLGAAPLYGLAKALLAAGKAPRLVLGFNRREDIFYEKNFRALGVDTVITTVDGSAGVKGFVTDALPEQYDMFCACGPLPMLKALDQATTCPGQFSFEERMGCGFGACMGCTVKVKGGYKRICKDGPVLVKEEILW